MASDLFTKHNSYSGDPSRSGKPRSCEAVLIFFRVVPKFLPGPEIAGKIRNLPGSWDDAGMKHKIVPKVNVTLKLGAASQDLKLQFYVFRINDMAME